VKVHSYTITQKIPGNGYLKDWVIEISNNLNDWTIIDNQIDFPNFSKNNQTVHINITTPQSEFTQFVRIRITGKNKSGDEALLLSQMEFYGEISFGTFQQLQIG
jgi:hypothetical protein